MTGQWLLGIRQALAAGGCVAVAAAPLVSHAAIVTGQFTALATGLAALQGAALVTVAWRSPRRPARVLMLVAAALLLALLLARLWRPTVLALPALLAASGVSHAIIYGSLLLLFGQSLRSGGGDLITSLASRLRGGLTPAMQRYTRGVTWLWCGFFAGQLIASALLLAWAPHWAWSLFVNVLDLPLVVLTFAAEYAVRRVRFRHYAHISPLETVRSFTHVRRTGPDYG